MFHFAESGWIVVQPNKIDISVLNTLQILYTPLKQIANLKTNKLFTDVGEGELLYTLRIACIHYFEL